MSRRSPSSEVGFGSDSFLDIIANIVGILIILIVVAGVRVSQAPVVLPVDEAVESDPQLVPHTSPVPEEVVPPLAAVAPPPAVPESEPEEEPEPETVYVREPAPAPSPELRRRLREVRASLAALDSSSSEADERRRELAALDRAERDRLRRLESTLAAENERLRGTDEVVGKLGRALAADENRVVQLRRQAEREEAADPDVKPIRHRLTPVSRVVRQSELHFRLAGNRIAPIPLEELVDRVGSQVQRQKDWLVKYRSHQGRVGPVDGFSMDYVVQRQSLSAVDKLRGTGVVRIGVARWELVPEETLRDESFEQAMQPGSRFRRALEVGDPDTTLTFWVYPDSFDLYRRLQEVAQRNDFTVAGRPLPFDVPIAGSPNGTRSAGQ